MKKAFLLCNLFFLIFAGQKINCQGLENFNNYKGTAGHYHNGTFIGQDGSTWTYKQCRNDRPINSPSPCLGKARDTLARVCSGTILNGCGLLSFDYKQAYSTAVNLDVYVNNVRICNVTSPGGSNDTANIHNSGPIPVHIPGNFVIEFVQADSTGSGQVTIDNVEWTCDTALQEPTNYPTDLIATPGYFKVTLNWKDATGGQVPTAYLVEGSDSDDIQAPVDGVPVADDPNLGDGNAVLNVLPGVQTCLFTGLLSNTTYYFAIYPYTNSGTLIDYKTDKTAPAVNATTSDGTIIFHHDFNDFTLSPMISQSVLGPGQVWKIDSSHGTSSSACAGMNGRDVSTFFANEDWLITPAMNFNNYSNETLSFMSAYDYTGDLLMVKISNDYDGSGDPNDFNWTDLPATWSSGGFLWTYSGDINVSGTNGDAVYIGFIYTSDTINAPTWKLDDILVTGTLNVGIGSVNYSDNFTISPNPAHGMVKIAFNKSRDREIRIMNIIGGCVYQETTGLMVQKIDLTNFSTGVYFVEITDRLTLNISVRKIILL
jgi:hypothetical protein